MLVARSLLAFWDLGEDPDGRHFYLGCLIFECSTDKNLRPRRRFSKASPEKLHKSLTAANLEKAARPAGLLDVIATTFFHYGFATLTTAQINI